LAKPPILNSACLSSINAYRSNDGSSDPKRSDINSSICIAGKLVSLLFFACVVFISLLLGSDDPSLLLYAFIDDKQAEFRIGGLAKSISKICELLSLIKLRVSGDVGEFDAMEYCPVDILVELERLEETVLKLLETKEQVRQIVLEREELTAHPSDEDTPTKIK
ncbi:MAG: hypothetical protein AAFY76_04795, partial [Cyanobacteria bacterium J06649_11]